MLGNFCDKSVIGIDCHSKKTYHTMKTLEWNAERRVPREFNRLTKIYAKGRECENPRQWARFVKQVRGGTSGPSDKKTEEILWTCLKKTFRGRPTSCRTNFYGIAQDILLFADMDKVRIDKFSWTYHPHRNIEITRKFNHTQRAIVSRNPDHYRYWPQNGMPTTMMDQLWTTVLTQHIHLFVMILDHLPKCSIATLCQTETLYHKYLFFTLFSENVSEKVCCFNRTERVHKYFQKKMYIQCAIDWIMIQ